MVLIGSSLVAGSGTLRRALPSRVSRLLLLNSGFELEAAEHIVGGPANLAAWRRTGIRRFQMPSDGSDVDIPYTLVEATNAENGTPLSRCHAASSTAYTTMSFHPR